MLDDYYVSVVRTSDGNILNEKRYILPPTRVTDSIFNADGDGWIGCSLSQYQTSLVQDNHFVNTQVIITGTQNPFNCDENGNRTYSKPEELQYGNGVKGVDGFSVKVEVVSDPNYVSNVYDETGYLVVHQTNENDNNGNPYEEAETEKTTRRFLKVSIKFTKNQRDGTDLPLIERIQRDTKVIDQGQVTVILSHKNPDNIAKYHILNRSSNLYFKGSLPMSLISTILSDEAEIICGSDG